MSIQGRIDDALEVVMADTVLTYSKADVREDWDAIVAARKRLAEMERDFVFVAEFLRRKNRGDWIPAEASALFSGDTAQASPKTEDRKRGKAPAEGGTWMSEISAVIAAHPNGVSAGAIRDALREGPFAANYKNNPAGYYNGISKLERSERVVRYKDRFFTPPHMSDFLARLRRGEVEDLSERPEEKQTIIDQIQQHVARHPEGVAAKDLVDEMASPEMSPGTIYNNLHKAVLKNRLRREGKKYFPIKE